MRVHLFSPWLCFTLCFTFCFTFPLATWVIAASGLSQRCEIFNARAAYTVILGAPGWESPDFRIVLPCFIYWGGPFCAPAFCYVLRTKKRGPSLSCCFEFAPISIGLRPSKSASKPAPRYFCFQCPWSPYTGVRNFVSSHNFWFLLQFSIP